MTVEQSINAAEKNLERVLAWHPRIDSRVIWAVGIYAGMFGYLVSAAGEAEIWSLSVWALLLITIFILLNGLWNLYAALTPDTRAPSKSLLFFGQIGCRPYDDFASQWRSLTFDGYLTDLNEQVHRNSEIITQKFRSLKNAMQIIVVAVVPWAVCIAVLHSASRSPSRPSTGLEPITAASGKDSLEKRQ